MEITSYCGDCRAWLLNPTSKAPHMGSVNNHFCMVYHLEFVHVSQGARSKRSPHFSAFPSHPTNSRHHLTSQLSSALSSSPQLLLSSSTYSFLSPPPSLRTQTLQKCCLYSLPPISTGQYHSNPAIHSSIACIRWETQQSLTRNHQTASPNFVRSTPSKPHFTTCSRFNARAVAKCTQT